jgi:hypothetical protein
MAPIRGEPDNGEKPKGYITALRVNFGGKIDWLNKSVSLV